MQDFDNLSVLKGEEVDRLLLSGMKPQHSTKKRLTARELLNSDAIGMWKDRTDITDSSIYARQLRKQAETRSLDYLKQRYCNNGSSDEK